MSVSALFRNALASGTWTNQRHQHRHSRGLRRTLAVECLEMRRLMARDVAVVDNGEDAAFAAIVAQLNDNTQGLDITATLVQPSDVDTIAELNAFDAVVLANDGTSPTSDSFPVFAAALNDWVQNHFGGVVAVGYAAFGMRGQPEEAQLDLILPVAIGGSLEQFEVAGNVLDIDPSHPVTSGVNDITVGFGNIFESVAPPADSWGTVLGDFGSGNLGVVVGYLPTGTAPGNSVYLGPDYAGSSANYNTSELRSGDADRLLEQAVVWAGAIIADPDLTTNRGISVDQGGAVTITTFELKTTDNDDPTSEVVYTVTSPPTKGVLNLDGAPTTTFTQQDIDQGRVTYVHDGLDAVNDSFTFTVSDGENTDGPATFNITVVADAPASAVVDGSGNLVVRGTPLEETVTITGIVAGSGNYLVTIQSGTDPVVNFNIVGVTGGFDIDLEGRDDSLTINNALVSQNIRISMGAGNDDVSLGETDIVSTGGSLSVRLEEGDDTLVGQRLYIGRDQHIYAGEGNDELIFEGFAAPDFTLGTSAGGTAYWRGDAGDDVVRVVYGFIVEAWVVLLGDGQDTLDVFGSAVSGDVIFSGEGDADTLTVDTNFFDASHLLLGGGGNDILLLANGLGTEFTSIDTGAGNDRVTVRNQTTDQLSVDTGAGSDEVDVRASALETFFAGLGDDDDQLTVQGNLVELQTALDGGIGSADRLFDLGNSFRGGFSTSGFELRS